MKTLFRPIIVGILLTHAQHAGSADYQWTKGFTGASGVEVTDVTVDPSGNIYVVGHFSGTVDFRPDAGVDMHSSNGGEDIFFTRINNDFTYGYTRTMGGSLDDKAVAVEVDAFEHVYLTGEYRSTVDFDPTAGTDNHTVLFYPDIFLTRINTDGTYGWTKTFPGNDNDDSGLAIGIEVTGAIYLTGRFQGTVDFDPGVSSDFRSANGFTDLFLTKIEGNGTYGWTKTLGGLDRDEGSAVTVDKLGNVYVVGSIRNQVDLDPDPTTLLHNSMDTDLVIMKIDGGGAFAWSKVIAGGGFQIGKGVATTQLGDVYLTGQFSGSPDFDPGMGTDFRSSTGETDIFLTKINASGSYGWTYTLGSGGVTSEQGLNLVPDKFNNIYVAGSYQGTVDFDPGTNVSSHITRGGHDAFVIRFDADGQFRWVQTFGGTLDDFANGVAIDNLGQLFVAGTFRDAVDFDPSASTNLLTSAGGSDGFLSHFVLRSDMSVLGIGQTIANNDTTPRIADGTDFGNVQVARGEGARTNQFTIQSTGEKELILDGNPLISLTDVGRFSVIAQPGASLNPGQTGTVSIRFDPTNSGYFKTTVSVSSDDPDANPYRFDIQGYSDTELQITHLTHSDTNVVLTWSAVSNRTFSIWKGTNLLQGFPIRVFGNLLSTPPMNTMNIPLSSNEPSAYFRIQVD